MNTTDKEIKAKLSEDFWIQTLEGADGFHLPAFQDEGSCLAAEEIILLPADTTRAFDAASGGNPVNRFVLAATALAATVSRYARKEDILLTSPGFTGDSGQTSIFLRLDVPANISGKSLLGSVQKKFKEAYGYRHYHAGRFRERFEQNNTGNPRALVQTGLWIEGVNNVLPESDLPALLLIFRSEKGFSLRWDSSKTDDRFARRFGSHFATLLHALLKTGDQAIARTAMLTPAEVSMLTVGFNQSQVEFDRSQTVIDLFEKTAQAFPDRPAVKSGETVLSFRELKTMADRLAAFLLNEIQIKEEELVGIMLGRSESIVVAMLGIMKAGGAYVPVDPNYPEDRLNFLLEDSECRIVLVDNDYRGQLAGSQAVTIGKAITGDYRDTVNRAKPGGLAYSIYTSGSTGRPKGALIEHVGLANHVHWFNRQFSVNEWDQTMLVTSYSFDGSVTYIWSCLTSGACLHILSDEELKDPGFLLGYIRREGITFLKMVPSLFSMLVTCPGFAKGDSMATVRFIKLGGESFPLADVAAYFKKYPQVLFANHYGATEATIGSVIQPIRFEDFPRFCRQPVMGKPYDNFEIFILDENRELLPPGVTGEIYIGGIGVSRGYYKRPELTADRFVPHYLRPGERMYKTGDLGFWTEDGAVVFQGRCDTQVKIRGYRIETEEIRYAIRQCGWVDDAVVLAIKNASNDLELNAWVTGRPELDPAALKKQLSARLPAFMQPSAITLVTAIPTNQNGKLDVKKLVELAAAGKEEGEIVPAENELEEKLLAIWSKELGREIRSVQSQFFESGGNSLKAIRIMAAISNELHTDVSVRDLFVHTDIRSLARFLAASEKAVSADIPVLPSATRYPASNAQRRLWILQHLENSSRPYHIGMAFAMKGTPDLPALEKSVRALVERHEILRTTFVREGETIYQVIHEVPGQVLEMVQQDAPEFRDRFFAREFDLTSGPLFRIGLQKTREELLLLVSLHHIISDEWSMQVMVSDLQKLYPAFAFDADAEPKLPQLKIQYKDFAGWQTAYLQSEKGRDDKKFWQEKLSGDLTVLNFPADYPRPAVQTYSGSLLRHEFDAGLAAALKKLAASRKVSMYTLLTAITKAMFGRYTGQEDVILGTSSSGRTHPALLDQVGFYVNTVVLRSEVKWDVPFSVLLEQVRETLSSAFQHEAYPFDLLAEDLLQERDPSRNPFFDIAVEFSEHRTGTAGAGLELVPVSLEEQVSKFDMTLHYMGGDGRLELLIEYNTNLFCRKRMEAVARHLEMLSSSVCADAEQPVGQLDYLTDDDKDLVFTVLSGKKADYDISAPFHVMISRCAEQTPDAPALIHDDTRMSYRELDETSGRLAALLRADGLQKGDFAGILLPRGRDMLIAMVAIMKAGGAFVPVELTYPADRIRYMLEDSQVNFVITDLASFAGMHEMLLLLPQNPVLIFTDENVPAEGAAWQGKSIFLHSDREITPQKWENKDIRSRMYMIYTSGSTGQPKGAVLRHDGVMNHVYALLEPVGISAGFRFLQSAPVSSDIAVWQFLAPLIRGGATVIADYTTVLDPRALFDCIRKNEVDVVELVPALAQGILEHIGTLQEADRALPALKCMIITGEALPPHQVNDWLGYYPAIPVMNAYGPTEASDDILFKMIEQPLPAGSTSVSIGFPVANCPIILLDRFLHPVAPGFDGEICVAGIGVGEGYWNKPEKTREAFIPNPFGELAGDTIYRTGDIGRWSEAGDMIFLGRRDAQVKIRGNRIELEEIEARLCRLQGIREAVAVVTQQGGEKIIAAYLVEQDEATDDDSIRSRLQGELPSYMIPSVFVRLVQLPVLPNGKTDRKGLSQRPVENSRIMRKEKAPAVTLTEKTLVQIWEEHLKTEGLGIDDNFFALGGHSLQVVIIIEKISRRLTADISVKDFFTEPTIRSLARIIEERKELRRSPIPVATEAADYVLSGAQRRLWLHHEIHGGSREYNVLMGTLLEGDLDESLFLRSFQSVVHRNEIFRTIFVQSEGIPRQRILASANAILNTEDISGMTAAEQQEIIEARFHELENHFFDLSAGPLLTGRLLKMGAGRHLFIICFHHIITDEWTEYLFVREFAETYRRFRNREAEAAPPRIQYKDYAEWHEKWLSGSEHDNMRRFWETELSAPLPANPLPADFQPDSHAVEGAEFVFQIDREQATLLEKMAREKEMSLFNIIIASWLSYFAEVSFARDLIMGFPSSGREHPDLVDQMGFFINMLPLRIRLSRDFSFDQVADITKNKFQSVMMNQGYPFDQIVSDTSDRAKRDSSQLFDWGITWAMMQQVMAGNSETPDQLRLSRYPRKINTAHHGFWIYGGVQPSGDIELSVRYKTSVYKAETIRAMSEGYVRFVRLIMAAPGKALKDAATALHPEKSQDPVFNIELDI